MKKSDFLKFTVTLPEKGDVAGLQRMLAEYPDEHRALLFQSRRGGDGGNYSVLGYTTLLCMSGGRWAELARPVLDWLIEQGVPEDIWVDVARADRQSMQNRLAENPALADAEHPVWGTRLIEYVPVSWRADVIEAGAEVADVFSAILLGDDKRVAAMVDVEPSLVHATNRVGLTLLEYAIVSGRDALAGELLELGADPDPNPGKIGPLVLACIWGCTGTLAKLAVGHGANLKRKVAGRSLFLYVLGAPVPSAEVARYLLEQGIEPESKLAPAVMALIEDDEQTNLR